MKAFLIFLGGALLGSVAAWFLWLANLQGVAQAPDAPHAVEPASVAVTPAASTQAPPTSRPAIASDAPPDAATPAAMVPAVAVPGTETGTTSLAHAPEAPVDAAHAAVLPPETTPAPSGPDVLLPPPASPSPLRQLELLVPVAGVKPTQLLDTYTDARGESRTHEAIDIPAPVGTPVYAVEDGPVAKLFDSKQGGLTVYQFDRFGELAYYYAHLDSYAPGLAEKQMLKKGDLVGTVGYTGNANPQAPHLHFAIFRLGPEKKWWKGTPINPYPFLRNGTLRGP
jgi:murein DD-endopeptidase MepM/ murein hydrolase activator NlpD